MFDTIGALIFYLVAAHFVVDTVLQPPDIAKGKNRNRQAEARLKVPPGQKFVVVWPYYMAGHTFFHGMAVAIITGVWWLGLLETIAHATIDFFKCENAYGPQEDQALHLACKAVWVAIVLGMA